MAAISGDIAYKFLDSTTGEYASYKEVTHWWTGDAMTDDRVDGVIYRKKDDTYYKRVLPDGRINFRWFGVTPDSTGAENLAAFNKMLVAGGLDGHLFIPEGEWDFADIIWLPSWSGCLEGVAQSTGGNRSATVLNFPPGKDGIHVRGHLYFPETTIRHRGNCIVRHLTIQGAGKSDPTPSDEEPERKPCGLFAGNVFCCEDVNIQQFGGDGIIVYAHISGAPTSSNVSLSTFARIVIAQNGRHGVWCAGPDANACYFEQVDVRDNGDCGIYDNSFLGNMFFVCHANNNLTYPYRVGDHGNSRALFHGCYSEGDGWWPTPGEPGQQCSDFATGWVIGGLHGVMPHNGRYLAEFGDGIGFRKRYRGGDLEVKFQDGMIEYWADRVMPNTGGQKYRIRMGVPSNTGPAKYKGAFIHMGPPNDTYGIDPMLSFLGPDSQSSQIFGTDRNRSMKAWSTVLAMPKGLLVSNRFIEVMATPTLDEYYTNPYHRPHGQFFEGDIIINGSRTHNKKLAFWRCVRAGVKNKSASELTALGTGTGASSIFRFDDTDLTIADVAYVIQVGDSVRLVGDPTTNSIIDDIIIDDGKVALVGGSFQFGLNSTLEYIEPVHEPVYIAGYLGEDFTTDRDFADNAAAISGGLEVGDEYHTSGVLKVVV